MRANILLILIVGLFLGLVGCVTSVQYQVGAKNFIPTLTDQATAYVNADSTSPLSVKTDRLTQLAALKADVATQSKIDRIKLTQDWKAVEPWFLGYVDNDASLDAIEKALRHDVASRFDKLGTDDSNRPFAKIVSPATQP